MAHIHIPDPEELMQCPYERTHMVAAKRMQYHLMKCRRNYPGREFATCPFNARHEMPKPELRYHIANCPDKAMLEPILSYEQSKNSEEGQNFKGCTDLPRYDDSYTASSRNAENWDEEIPENPRIGVDPSFFARMEYKDNTGFSRSEKKAWKTQLHLPPDQRRLPMQKSHESEAFDEEETSLRKPKINPASFKVNKPQPTQNPVLSYSLAMAGIGRGGGAQGMGMPRVQPVTDRRGVGRSQNGAPIGQGLTNGDLAMAQGMGMTNYMATGVAMPGPTTVPPMGRAMGRAAAREKMVSRNVAMANMNGHAVMNGNSGMVPAPPGFNGQFDDAQRTEENFAPVGRGSSSRNSPQNTGSRVPAGIGRGRGVNQMAQMPSFTVGVGRGLTRDIEGSPAFVVPKISTSPEKRIESQDTNNNNDKIDADTKAKELKKIEKKLKQIEMLEEKGEKGYIYNTEELMKIKAKEKLLKALENLKL